MADPGKTKEYYEKGMSHYRSKEYKEALKWFRESSGLGSADAMYMMGIMNTDGNGIDKSNKRAVKWMVKAAENGHVEAMRIVGNCYCHGVAVEQDDKTAADWYRRAADGGDASAMFSLACYLFSGEGLT